MWKRQNMDAILTNFIDSVDQVVLFQIKTQ